MTPDWIAHARQPVAHVAQQLGYPSRNRHYPCPARCDGRSKLPVYATAEGWRCSRCGAGGDSVDFVSTVLHGARFRTLAPDQKDTVRAWFGAPARAAYVPPPVTPLVRPSPEALQAFWDGCRPIDRESGAFLRGRGIDPASVAHVARSVRFPYPNPPAFWRAGKGRTWRLVTPGYVVLPDGQHQMANIHARAIVDPPVVDGQALSKALWLKGVPSAGVVMWNGVLPETACLVFAAEGVTDFWTACAVRWESPVCVYGATSGGFSALARIRIRKWTPVVIAPDPDGAGDVYADQIRGALPGTVRVALPPRVDVNDYVRRGGAVRELIASALAE